MLTCPKVVRSLEFRLVAKADESALIPAVSHRVALERFHWICRQPQLGARGEPRAEGVQGCGSGRMDLYVPPTLCLGLNEPTPVWLSDTGQPNPRRAKDLMIGLRLLKRRDGQ